MNSARDFSIDELAEVSVLEAHQAVVDGDWSADDLELWLEARIKEFDEICSDFGG